MRRTSDRGGALVTAVIVALATAALTATILTLSLASTRGMAVSYEARRATAIAEAGLHAALRELNTKITSPPAGADSDTPPNGIGNIGSAAAPLPFDGGLYWVTAAEQAPGSDRWVLRAVAVFPADTTVSPPVAAPGAVRRGIEAIVTKDVPADVLAAVTLFGDMDLKKFEMKPKGGNAPLIDGTTGSVPGLLFENAAFYDQFNTSNKVKIVAPSQYLGMPPKTQNSNAEFSAEFWDQVRESIYDKVQMELMPIADVVETEKNIDTPLVYGSPTDPQIVVFDTGKVHVHNGGSITGYGTLIITGKSELKLHNGTTALNWTGDIIVMGDDGPDKSQFKQDGGNVVINGNLWVVSDDDKKAKVDLKHESNTTINGSLFLLSGSNDKEKSELKIKKKPTVTVNGLVVVQGSDKLKLDLRAEDNPGSDDDDPTDDPHITVNGALAAGRVNTPDDPKKDFDFRMKGDVDLLYNAANVAAAKAYLSSFLGLLDVPAPYAVISWREFVPGQ